MKIFKLNRRFLISLVLLIVVLFTMTACDKRNLDPNAIQLTRLVCDKVELYEDNGASWANLTATVKDNNGFPVLDQTINFKADNPNISFLPARAVTDSSGLAKTQVFVSGNILNGQDSLQIFVSAYLGTKQFKEIPLMVRKNPQAQRIIMQGLNTMTLDVNYAMTVSAIAYGANNVVMPNGTYVTFQTNGGYFIGDDEVVSQLVQARVVNGTATVNFNTGTQAGAFTITSYIGQIYVDNPKTINIKPGIPKLVTLEPRDPETNNLLTGVSVNSNPVIVTGQLTDEWSNPITGKIVTLTTNLGVIPESVTTGENGIYSVMYNPGSVSGIALINAVCDSAKTVTMLNITSDIVQYMKFTNEGTINLSVQGSGGTESATLGVKLYDNIGNVINQPGKRIKFTFESKPEGTLINSAEFAIVETDINGLASVFISSGTQSGIAVLKAILLDENDEPTNIFVKQGRIIIQAGKPNSVAFTIAGYDSGANVGAGNWRVVIGAIIKDMYGNPVEKNTGVYFSLTDSTVGAFGDSVTVVASSFVGNVSATGDSAAGTAYSTLIYHGRLSNMSVEVKASVGSYNEDIPLDYTGFLKLPMQNMTLIANPQVQHLDWLTPGGDNDLRSTFIFVTAIDGQNNLIRNVPLMFLANKGEWLGNFDDPQDTDGLPYTGITDYEGMNKKKIQFMRMEAMPPNPPGVPMDSPVEGTVYIRDTNVVAPIQLILRRYY